MTVRETEWLRFEPAQPKAKTSVWLVLTKDTRVELGRIQWFAPWRCYAFFAEFGTVFEKTCLRDLAKFCEQLTDQQRHRITGLAAEILASEVRGEQGRTD